MNAISYNGRAMKIMTLVSDLIALNVVYLISCIPIITIGAATTSLLAVTMRMARHEHGYILKPFFRDMKQNFRTSTVIWLGLLILGALLGIEAQVVRQMSIIARSVWEIGIGLVVIFVVIECIYVFAYIARFQDTIRGTIKTSLMIGICNFPWTIGLIGIITLSVVLLLKAPAIILALMSVVFCSGLSLICAMMFRQVFSRYDSTARLPRNQNNK